MRVIKNKNVRYEAFSQSLPLLSNLPAARESLRLVEQAELFKNQAFGAKNDAVMLSRFLKSMETASTFQEVTEYVCSAVSEVIRTDGIAFFIYNDDVRDYSPLTEVSARLQSFIKRSHKGAVIEWLAEINKPVILPDYNGKSKNSDAEKYLLFHCSGGKRILAVILLSQGTLAARVQKESELIELYLRLSADKIERILLSRDLTSAYNELQVCQSKLTNDFRLSAIGELTTGVAEEILSPLQVILSNAELLQKDEQEQPVIDNIHLQVKKIENLVSRLLKFANISVPKLKLQPCYLNKIIADYHSMIDSSLGSENYECLLSLDENIPSILSNQVYINQLLTNIFSLIRNYGAQGGGISVQTRYSNEKISVRFVLTKDLCELKETGRTELPELKIIEKIMTKHEGEARILELKNSGSVILLIFPLKRKVRK